MGSSQSSSFNSKEAYQFIERQCALWDTARYNYEALAQVKTRELEVKGSRVVLQFNTARILSSSARVDAASLRERPCFLCDSNRPSEQMSVSFSEEYEILTNPYPIFSYHLTVPSKLHQPQRISRRLGVMLQLARQLKRFVIFYNGPHCGASAPDHAHFQAGNRGMLPIEKDLFGKEQENFSSEIIRYQSASLRAYPEYSRPFFEIRSAEGIEAVYLFSLVYDALEAYSARNPDLIFTAQEEPMMNLLTWYEEGEWVIALFPRNRHRPSCYEASGGQNILLSPGAVDMGGFLAVPQKKDFDKISAEDLKQIFSEVCFDTAQIEEIVKLINR